MPPDTVPPRTNLDIMNYGAPRWISPYTYSNLFRAVGAPPKVHDPCRVTLPPRELLFPEVYKQFIRHYLVGLPGEGVIGKLSGPRIKVQFPPLKREGPTGSVRVTVLDGQGATLFKDTFEATPLFEDVADIASLSESHADPARYQFAISVPDLAGAKRLIVEYGGKVIEDIGLSAKPVDVRARTMCWMARPWCVWSGACRLKVTPHLSLFVHPQITAAHGPPSTFRPVRPSSTLILLHCRRERAACRGSGRCATPDDIVEVRAHVDTDGAR